MPRNIVKHMVDGDERFLVWSSIVDAPITHGMSLSELKAFWREEYGRHGLEELERDIGRGGWTYGLLEIAVCNRAGEDETTLTIAQIVDFYFVRRCQGQRPRGRRAH